MRILRYYVLLIICQLGFTIGKHFVDYVKFVIFYLSLLACVFKQFIACSMHNDRSHHEKLVIVDHHICFIGGLDLCFGRYDTMEHKVSDFPPHTWPGKDYYNPR